MKLTKETYRGVVSVVKYGILPKSLDLVEAEVFRAGEVSEGVKS